MKKTLKTSVSLILSVIMVLSCCAGASAMSQEDWDAYFASDDIAPAVTMYVGSDETQRNFAWYSSSAEGNYVLVSKNEDLSDGVKFDGIAEKAPQGDYAIDAAATGLEAGATYYYSCVSSDYTSPVYSFRTLASKDFKAVYMTDIHIGSEKYADLSVEENLNATGYKFNQTMEAALATAPDVSLLLSAGDQATLGLRNEYTAFTATPVLDGISVATTIGNHDRKGVDYKYFNNVPNEFDGLVSSYVGSDYWFVKGDVLFLVCDSNSGSGIDHSRFIKSAIEANPDVKWRVAMYHHDLYGQRIEHRESENKFLRLLWAPLMDEYSIDLVLLGHSHYYTVTNIMFNGRTTDVFDDNGTVTDPEGSVYMVSGSVNNPRGVTEGEEVPLGENVRYDILTDETIYNIISFTEDTITVDSYTVQSGEHFNSYSITKTSQQGGHKDTAEAPFFIINVWNRLVRILGTIYTVFNNIGIFNKLTEDGFRVNFFDALF